MSHQQKSSYSRIGTEDEPDLNVVVSKIVPQTPLVVEETEERNPGQILNSFIKPRHGFERLPSEPHDEETSEIIYMRDVHDNIEGYTDTIDFHDNQIGQNENDMDDPLASSVSSGKGITLNEQQNSDFQDDLHPTISTSLSGSQFVLSDDDSDDETNHFHKYLTPTSQPLHQEENFLDDIEMNPEKSHSSLPSKMESSFHNKVVTPLNQIISAIHSAQEASRQRRMQRLLSALPEDESRSKCHYFITKAVIFLSSRWCDLTDSRGWLLVFLFTAIIFAVWRILESTPIRRDYILATGIILLVIRIGSKPLYWFLWGRRVERVRNHTPKTLLGIYRNCNHIVVRIDLI